MKTNPLHAFASLLEEDVAYAPQLKQGLALVWLQDHTPYLKKVEATTLLPTFLFIFIWVQEFYYLHRLGARKRAPSVPIVKLWHKVQAGFD